MSDIDAMLGIGVTPQGNMQALADNLRGQQRAGQFLSLSQLTPAANLGQNLMQGAQTGAQEAGRRQLEQQQGQLQRAQQQKLQQMRDEQQRQNRAQTKQLKEEEMERDFGKSTEYVNKENGKKIQVVRRAGVPYVTDPTDPNTLIPVNLEGYEIPQNKTSRSIAGTRKLKEKFNENVGRQQQMVGLAEGWKENYSASSVIPGTGTLVRYASEKAPNIMRDKFPEYKEEADWWKSYDLYYTIEERNRIFGSALTAQEKIAWDKANISADDDKDTIRQKLAILSYLNQKAARLDREDAREEGLSDDYIQRRYGWLDNYPDFKDLAQVPEGSGMGQKEWDQLDIVKKQEYYANAVPNDPSLPEANEMGAQQMPPQQQAGGLTPEEEAELQALEAQYGGSAQ